MKKKQGFTLIELLAVIVILAIIALIATPMILGVIEKAKKGAAENSVLGYIDAIEKTNFENMLDGEELEPGSYDTTDIQVKYKGEGPTKGFIIMGKEKVTNATLCINNYYVMYDGQTAKVDKNKTCDEVVSIKEQTDEECFAFSNGSITDYYDNEGNDSKKPSCPRYVVIPETIGGKSVTNIGAWAFSYNKLIGITIPTSIKTIKEGSFQGNKLTSIKIPSSVTSIEIYAFSNNQLSDDQAFIYKRNSDGSEDKTTIVSYGGANKDNVIIPSWVTRIGAYAFFGTRLTGVTIPNNVTYIGPIAFNGNFLPDDQAFIYARNNDGSEDKTTIVSYGGAKRNDVVIPSGVKTIREAAFYTNQLTSITIPSSVTSIFENAFGTNQLTSVKIIGKLSSSDFTTYGTNIWGWASGYNDSNITWNATE